MRRSARTRRSRFAAFAALSLAPVVSVACADASPTAEGAGVSVTSAPVTTTTTPTATTGIPPTTTTPPTTTAAPPTSTTPTTTTDTSPTTISAPGADVGGGELLSADYPQLELALFFLSLDNVAVSISVRRDGVEPWGRATGRRIDGAAVSSDTPFVVASVSKLVTALSVARLVQRGDLTVDTPVPWGELGLPHDPAWRDVTVRELLDHTSGMPVNRRSWLDDPGPCSIPLAAAVAAPPTETRGEWRYSNGNYCALGLLVERITGDPLDVAADELVFAPAGVTGPSLSTQGVRDDMAPSPRGIGRLARLGGAGAWLASTDDVTAVLADVDPTDLDVLRWPGVMVDQYGWGHTGTLDGAKACAWVMEDGRTTVAATVSGSTPRTGGEVCDAVVQALATDLGIWAGEPFRTPI